MKNKGWLRLKDVENISNETVDYVPIMSEVLGYNNNLIGRKLTFKYFFKKAYMLVREAKKVDILKLDLQKDCKIKVPKDIDSISFRAMMELQSTLQNADKNNFTQTVVQIIAIVCFQENFKEDYDSNSSSFIAFKETILNSPIWQMMGIYNWIYKKEKESKLIWQKRFLSVQVADEDYEQAGGQSMQQFNVINTLKILCRDFNCTDTQAWQKSYALSQTNSYAIATQNYVQDQMRKLKEVKMKKARNNNH